MTILSHLFSIGCHHLVPHEKLNCLFMVRSIMHGFIISKNNAWIISENG
jgi:hypothetical protein